MKVATAECPKSSLSLVRQNDAQRYFRLIEFCRKIYPREVNVTAIKVNKLNEVAIFHHMRSFPYLYGYRKGLPNLYSCWYGNYRDMFLCGFRWACNFCFFLTKKTWFWHFHASY